jgi:alkylation response protein AidB-like acyl-CoA dehydrogenase
VILAGGGTEENSGGNWTALSATARKADGGWILNGRKRFVSGALAATHFYSFIGIETKATEKFILPHIGVFLIPVSTKGVRVELTWNAMGMRGSGSDDLVLDNVFVPANALAAEKTTSFLQVATYLGVATAALNQTVISFASGTRSSARQVSVQIRDPSRARARFRQTGSRTRLPSPGGGRAAADGIYLRKSRPHRGGKILRDADLP